MPNESNTSPSRAVFRGTFPSPNQQRPPEPELIDPVILSDDPSPVLATAPQSTKTIPQVRKPQATALRIPQNDAEETEGRATAATWKEMAVVYGISMVLHAAILMIFGLMILPQQTREELLSVIMKQADEESEQPSLDHIIQEPDLIEERAVPDSIQDATALVTSDTEAENSFSMNLNDNSLRLKPDTTLGPTLPVQVGTISSGRSEAARAQMLSQRGGNAASDAAVEAALHWLVSVQRNDGSWDYKDVGKSGGAGNLSSPTGATGLALLAFLGAGHTHTQDCKYQDNVKRGLQFLLNSGIKRRAGMDFRGNRPGNEGMYVQAICTTALAEAYGMTNDRVILPIAQEAVNFIVRAQHSEGGWRYAPNTPGDTSVVGWQVMALKSAYNSHLDFPRTVFSRTKRFLADVSHANDSQYSYMPGQPPRASTTSIGLLCRMYLGWKPDHPALMNGVKYLAKVGPSRDDIYYDYYASQVLIQFTGAKGDVWTKWNTEQRDWLVDTQKKTGPAKGSWDVIESGHKGERGGRLYTTCLAVMTLEIYYRVLPLYKDSALAGEF